MKRGGMFWKCILAAIVGVFFFSLITMLLWNWLVPVVFNGPVISYGQALGLLVLTKILFFGIGGRRSWNSNSEGFRQNWKNRFNEKLNTLTPEEREAFKKRMRDKWGCIPPEKKHTQGSDASND